MNETVFRELLSESLRREYAEFDNAPEHRFSFRHRLSMDRIFARYERNVRGLKRSGIDTSLKCETMPHYTVKQRVIFALVLVILMTLLAGRFFPIRSITQAQIDRLRSRYDFPSMRMTTAQSTYADDNFEFMILSVPKETDEYRNFLSDLVDMEIYTPNEVEILREKPLPVDARVDRFGQERSAFRSDDEGLLDTYRGYIASLEKKIEYYTERAQDPSRAQKGDTEFAEEIAEKYLPLPKSFLELLEKLFADPSDEDEFRNECLSDLDKDDRRYLSEINKI